MPRSLSKSNFLKGLQCHKALYLKFNDPQLADPITEAQQALFQSGTNVGILAQDLYPGGINPSTELPRNYRKSIADTRALIANKQTVIYEAGFAVEGLTCFVDILVRENDRWHAIEVKSSTAINEVYLWDAAFQYYVMEKWGLDIADISLCHINNQYVRKGKIEVHKLFYSESVRESIRPYLLSLEQVVTELKEVLSSGSVPAVDIGAYCDTPYTCEFHGHCWQHIPAYSIFNISRLQTSKKFELYKRGILEIKEIPGDFPLNERQLLQVTSEIERTRYIDKEAIRDFLTKRVYPLYFLDFETFATPVPMFDGSRPYQQLPFQYSLHIQREPAGPVEHSEFLADNSGDPRLPFLEYLIADLGESGSIIVYNQGFEVGRLRELIAFLDFLNNGQAPSKSPLHPERSQLDIFEAKAKTRTMVDIADNLPEWKAQIENIEGRIVDLMRPFQQKWYYAPEMRGNYSIKNVLPALVPEMGYEGLEIADGTSASRAFFELYGEVSDEVKKQTRENLLAYCRMDTLAMVEILIKLEEACQ